MQMKISLITACFMSAGTLRTALDSVLEQKGVDLDYIVVDGGSNVEINREDLRALRANGIWACLPLIYLKYLFKIWGFVFKRRCP